MSEKIMILDGNSLLFRAFYAMPPLKTKKGQYTNAVYGFLSMLYKLMEDYSPDYICTAFDPQKPTFRHKQYKEYKAQRAKAPDELVEQFGLIRRVLKLHNIKCVEIEGYEADDVAGTLAREAEQSGAEVYLVTSDKDYLQLIDDKTHVLLTKKGVTNIQEMDEASMEVEYGVTPEQFVDVKALMGDSSDNIPGVGGIGEKTAVKLIQEYKSLDSIYENIDNIKGKLKEKLENDKAQAYLSQTLARIIRDIPVEFDLEEYKSEPPDSQEMSSLYDELEFRNFKKRLKDMPKSEEKESSDQMSMFDMAEDTAEVLNGPSPDIIDVSCMEAVQVIADKALSSARLTVKIIPDNDRTLYSSAVALALSPGDGSIYYVDFKVLNEDEVFKVLKPMLESDAVSKSGHQIKNEVLYLMRKGISTENIGFDSEIGKYLLNPSESSYSIDKIAYEYLKEEITPENEYLGTGKSRTTFRDISKERCMHYGADVVSTVIRCEDMMKAEIESLGMKELFENIELPLVEVLAYMEYTGFKVDSSVLERLGEHFRDKIKILEEEIYDMAGERININSTRQLGSILFDKLGLPVVKKTKTGVSTDAEVLEKLRDEHPIVDKILEYRQLTKLNSTYVEGLGAVIDKESKRVHSVFNQTITTTGRISSTDPNLQNIPTRSDEGKELRRAFVAEDGYVLCDADYSQIELRVLAHLADEDKLIDAFKHHEDIHTKTASEVFKVSMEDVTQTMRSRAKAVNFGIVYGISDYGLSRDLSIPRKEAKVYIDNYLGYYDKIDKYMKDIIEKSKQDGYVETYFQRRRYIPELSSRNFNIRSFGERVALNTPVQGTAADIIKAAMVSVYRTLKLRGMKSRLILQVHDELIVEAWESEVDEVKAILKEEMENVVKDFKVKLEADVNTGVSWYEAK